ncbi:MAG: hypothetical protein ACON46_06890 [Coraliomargaritaceae bacterium]
MPKDSTIMEEKNSLVIDCSDGEIFCGVLDGTGTWLSTKQSGPGALEALFPNVGAVLQEADCQLDSVRRFIYCRGPGSVLGLRLAAMAIETWCRLATVPVERLSYGSLELTAALLQLDQPDLQDALILSDWKKDSWHALSIEQGVQGKVTALPTESLHRIDRPLYHLPRRKGWQAPPEGARTLLYEPARLDRVLDCADLLQAGNSIELFQPGGNTFTKWTAQRHRAESV